MNSTMITETTATQPTVARGWIAAGFALLAGAAIIVDSSALTRVAPVEAAPAKSVAIAAAAPIPELTAADWATMVTGTVTPGETVGAYDR